MKKINIIQIILRIGLGSVFVFSSIPKILNPSDFAVILYGYSIFPLNLINIIAIIFPFIEFFSGLSLIFGLFYKSALVIVNVMILFFIIIISFNLLRGHEFNCGCFSVGDPSHVSAAGQLLFRDCILFTIGLYLFFKKSSFHYNSES